MQMREQEIKTECRLGELLTFLNSIQVTLRDVIEDWIYIQCWWLPVYPHENFLISHRQFNVFHLFENKSHNCKKKNTVYKSQWLEKIYIRLTIWYMIYDIWYIYGV